MKGDFSRNSFDPERQYSHVLMQQGRVQIDADWNEQASILLGYMRALTRDLFGPAAGPSAECGFLILTADNPPKNLPADVQALLKDLQDDDLVVMPGRYYVHGIPVQARAPFRYRGQAGFPFGEAATGTLRGKEWFAYLEVWEDFVSADQDERIRDVALGGVDTCGRARVMSQVRLSFEAGAAQALAARAPTGSGRIKAWANPSEADDNLCSIAPDARFRGADNRLYRVEIHRGGKADGTAAAATFVWSRDNGSVAFPIRRGTGAQATLVHLGRDDGSTLVEGDWVELVDDRFLAGGAPGPLAQVTRVDRDDFRIELKVAEGADPLPAYAEDEARARHALLRRWDHRGKPNQNGGALAVVEDANVEVELEDGIKIRFEPGGEYRAGDYWTVPARVATGDVLWPGGSEHPDYQLPEGPMRYYAPLAASSARGAAKGGITDLRCRIERLPCLADAPATTFNTVDATRDAVAKPATGKP